MKVAETFVKICKMYMQPYSANQQPNDMDSNLKDGTIKVIEIVNTNTVVRHTNRELGGTDH